MARPYWSGNVQISLVSFGVSLYVATESKSQISFHQISRRTGERIRHQKVLESAAESREATTAVESDEIVKGYEYRKGQYVIIEPSELENAESVERSKTCKTSFCCVAQTRLPVCSNSQLALALSAVYVDVIDCVPAPALEVLIALPPSVADTSNELAPNPAEMT